MKSALKYLLCFIALLLCYLIAIPTIKTRQAQYNSVNSNDLLIHYYDGCITDTDCEALENELNFDFRKGVN